MQITALVTDKYPCTSFQWRNELNPGSIKRPPRQLYSARPFSKEMELEERESGNGNTHTGQIERLKRRLHLPPCCLGYHEPQWGQ